MKNLLRLLISFLMLSAILFLVGCTGGPGCPAAQVRRLHLHERRPRRDSVAEAALVVPVAEELVAAVEVEAEALLWMPHKQLRSSTTATLPSLPLA